MYTTSLKRVLYPWYELWGLDDLFRQVPERANGFPSLRAWQEEDKAVIEAELPGIEPAEVEITVKGRTLTISGERKAPELKEGESYYHRERWHGRFTRTVELPFVADPEKVSASFRQGLLTVTAQRAEADKPRKIEITLN